MAKDGVERWGIGSLRLVAIDRWVGGYSLILLLLIFWRHDWEFCLAVEC